MGINAVTMELAELIKECGFDFRDLTQHSPRSKEAQIRWTAKGGIKKFGHWKLFSADTPEHAVEKLLKELKKDMFEDFLKQKHAEEFPTLLDDDMPDHFDNWLGTLDGEDYIRYADEAIVEARLEGKGY